MYKQQYTLTLNATCVILNFTPFQDAKNRYFYSSLISFEKVSQRSWSSDHNRAKFCHFDYLHGSRQILIVKIKLKSWRGTNYFWHTKESNKGNVTLYLEIL